MFLGHPKFASSFDAGVKTAMTKRGFVGVSLCVGVRMPLYVCVLCTLKYRKHNICWFEASLVLTLMLGKMILD